MKSRKGLLLKFRSSNDNVAVRSDSSELFLTFLHQDMTSDTVFKVLMSGFACDLRRPVE